MKTVIHKIGNKINGQGVSFSNELLPLDDETRELLKNFFLGSFKSEETFQFYSDTYLSQNIVFNCISNIFKNEASFIDQSINIGRHLYDITANPRVQGGELFVVYFNEEDTKMIGLFKTERKEPFIKIHSHDEIVDLEKDHGISLLKIDKAALIYEVEQENGFVVNAIDNNKNGDLYYWFEDFLKIKQRADDYFHTQESLAIFRNYIANQLPHEFEVTKVDQADFLNKSLQYFKEKETFSLGDFTNEVLQDQEVIESFNNFKTDYEQERQQSIAEDFSINATAVKKQQRQFKSVLKLDKNFHIYIHGDRNKLELEQDDKGKFYKVYFENEA